MSEFKRENRYLVIKWKDAVAALSTGELDLLHGIANAVAEHRKAKGKTPLSCVVVEADWPIYEQAWDLVKQQAAIDTIRELARPCSQQLRSWEVSDDY